MMAFVEFDESSDLGLIEHFLYGPLCSLSLRNCVILVNGVGGFPLFVTPGLPKVLTMRTVDMMRDPRAFARMRRP